MYQTYSDRVNCILFVTLKSVVEQQVSGISNIR